MTYAVTILAAAFILTLFLLVCALVGGEEKRAELAADLADRDAETLRRAAALMRARAEEPVAQPERWPNFVAPALADLLENEASLIEGTESRPDLHMPLNGARIGLLVELANAYLQETP